MADTFTRTGNLGDANAAFGRTATDLGVAGATGIADYSGIQNGRTLSGPIMQPTDGADAIVRFNQVMAKYTENFEPFIQKSTMEHPRFYHDRVPRGAYTLFSGASKETRVFRGGLVHYAGLAHWGDIIDYSTATGGFNGQAYPNQHPAPVTYGYSWEKLQWSGKDMSWASDPIHVDMFRFTQDAQTQLSWILQAGVEFGISQQEVWNRDNLIFTAVQNGRCFIMTANGESAPASGQVYYNPYAYGSGAGYLAEVPFILFPADVDVQPLNFDVLDFANDALSIRAPGGGIGSDNGRPVFGLPIAMRDFEKYVKGNPTELANWREARATDLITGYGMLLKTYRYYAMVEDTNQLRFNVKRVVTAAEATAAGITVYGSSAATKLFLAEYVPPRKMGRIGDGGQGIPEENMEYIKADLAIAPLFMNNVFTNQFVPATPNLGSGTSFEPQTGLNGTWSWRNIIDKTTNPFGKVGNFYGTIEIFPKPEENFVNMTAFLYRRCNETLQSRCPVNIDEGTADTANIVSTGVTAEAAGEEILNTAITLKLTKTLDVTVGTPVSIAVSGYGAGGAIPGTIYGVIAATSAAPEYSVIVMDLNSVQGNGTDHATDFTSANFPAGGAVAVL